MGAAVAALGTGAQAGRKYLAGHTRGVSRKLRRRAEGGRAEARSPSGCGEAPGLGSAAVAEVRSEQEVQLNGWRGWKLLLYCESYLTPSLLFHDPSGRERHAQLGRGIAAAAATAAAIDCRGRRD